MDINKLPKQTLLVMRDALVQRYHEVEYFEPCYLKVLVEKMLMLDRLVSLK